LCGSRNVRGNAEIEGLGAVDLGSARERVAFRIRAAVPSTSSNRSFYLFCEVVSHLNLTFQTKVAVDPMGGSLMIGKFMEPGDSLWPNGP
jgi:hypothetical protein